MNTSQTNADAEEPHDIAEAEFATQSPATMSAEELLERFLTPGRGTPRPEEADMLALATQTNIVFRDLRLAVYSWLPVVLNPKAQHPQPILLVHGWAGRAGQLSAFVSPLTAAGFAVLAFDAPAHGASEGAQSNMPEFAAVIGVLSEQAGGFAGIVAHSMGAAAATMALKNSVPAPRFVGIGAYNRLWETITLFARRMRVSEEGEAEMHRRFEARFGITDWSRFTTEYLAAQMTIPALFIHDARDREVNWNDGATIARAWPGAELVTTTGLGHQRILRDPDVVARVTAFLTADA